MYVLTRRYVLDAWPVDRIGLAGDAYGVPDSTVGAKAMEVDVVTGKVAPADAASEDVTSAGRGKSKDVEMNEPNDGSVSRKKARGQNKGRAFAKMSDEIPMELTQQMGRCAACRA